MKWAEITVKTKNEEIDILCIRLEELGVGGMVIEDEGDFKDFFENHRQHWDYVDEDLANRFAGVSRVKFYLSDDEDGEKILHAIQAAGIETEITYIEDSDWENNWREHYHPLEIGDKLLIVPEWEQADAKGRVILRLDPGLIFGTGSHATTRMCLCALEKYSSPEIKALDLGCGSGILGIAALLLGCKSVTGCDIHPEAPEIALSNAGLNGIGKDRFTMYEGDILSDKILQEKIGTGYGIVLANIVADVIIQLVPMVRTLLAPGGVFICSGIIEGRQNEVVSAAENAGLTITNHSCEEEWHCFEIHAG